MLGLKVGASEAGTVLDGVPAKPQPSWPARVKLVISDSHEGIKAAVPRCSKPPGSVAGALHANALAHAGKTQRRMVSAAIGTVFVQESPEALASSGAAWPTRCAKLPKLSALHGRGLSTTCSRS